MVLMSDIGSFLQQLFSQGISFMQSLIETMAPLN